jgi:hypothetical protein
MSNTKATQKLLPYIFISAKNAWKEVKYGERRHRLYLQALLPHVVSIFFYGFAPPRNKSVFNVGTSHVGS